MTPTHRGARLLLVVGFGVLAAASLLSTSSTSVGQAAVRSQTIPGFVDIAPSLGLTAAQGAYGPNAVDFDRDGLLDVFLTNHFDNLVLLRQAPPGVFNDVASARGLMLGGDDKHGAAWGDCDEDGALDLFITRGVFSQDHLYRNQGNNTFNETAVQAGIVDQASTRAVTWFDYDNDGDLDILVVNIREVTNRLFRNDGGCSFTETTSQAGALTSRWHKGGVVIADYDGDGDLDVYGNSESQGTANPFDGNSELLRNNGNGSFSNVTSSAGLANTRYNGGAWGDYDNDGDLDLFLTRGWNARSTNPPSVQNALYRNNGNGTFTDVAASAGVALSLNSQHAFWADLDNDGDLDLYVANAGDVGSGNQPNFLYENQSNGTFLNVAASVNATGRTNGGMSGGTAAGDLDNNGFLDIFITHTLSSYGQLLSPHEILQNQGNANHWLMLDLRGQQSNSLGIGAWIELRTPNGQVQYREMVAGQHNFAQDDLRVHFGLGSQTSASQITVQWPSGVVDVLTNVPADQVLTLIEGSGGPGPTPTPTASQTPTATFTPTPVPPTATPTFTPTFTSTPAPTFTPTPIPPTATFTATLQPPTATFTPTPIPPTATPTASLTPAPPTDTPTASATPLPPTATFTSTAILPTDTPTASPTPGPPTDTPTPVTLTVTPTSSPTPVPPTNTPTASATPLPPTVTSTPTPVPPTNTPTPSPTPLPPTATLTPTAVPPTNTPTASPTPLPPTATPSPVEIIVDNLDPGFSSVSFWNTGSNPNYPYFGTNYRFTGPGNGSRQAIFTPNLPEAGIYEVFVWFFASPASGTNVPHTVNFNGGSTTVLVNRQGSAGGGFWLSLGTFNFAAGTSGSVVITNDADGFAVADAVRFVGP